MEFMNVEVRQEQYATDLGGEFPVWNVYINGEQACMCFEPTRAKLIANALDAYQSGSESASCTHQDAVMWNPYNHVVQCHRCGQQFVPAP